MSAVGRVPGPQREVVVLRYVLDLSQAEVAAVLGVAVGTASATLTAARSRLAVLLADQQDAEVAQ